MARLGSHNITSVLVKGVADALQNNAKDNIETKVCACVYLSVISANSYFRL